MPFRLLTHQLGCAVFLPTPQSKASLIKRSALSPTQGEPMARRQRNAYLANCFIFLLTFSVTTVLLTKVSVIVALVVAAKVVSNW